MTKAVHRAHLAVDPLVVVFAGAFGRVVEQALARPGDANGDLEALFAGLVGQPRPQLPGHGVVKAGELQLGFLREQTGKGVVHSPSVVPLGGLLPA